MKNMNNQQKSKIKGFLFDKDGTLIEFERYWHEMVGKVFSEIQERLGLSDEVILTLKKKSGVKAAGFEKESLIQHRSSSEISRAWSDELMGIPHVNEMYRGCSKELAEAIYAIMDAVSESDEIQASALEGVEEILKELKARGYILGVATADTLLSTEKSLKETGLYPYFDFLGCDDGHTAPKPDPSLARAFEIKMKLKPGEYVMVGDSLSDYQFSQNCKAPFVGIHSPYGELKNIGDDVLLIHRFQELKFIFPDVFKTEQNK